VFDYFPASRMEYAVYLSSYPVIIVTQHISFTTVQSAHGCQVPFTQLPHYFRFVVPQSRRNWRVAVVTMTHRGKCGFSNVYADRSNIV
jgi:hypothetical protein